MISGYLNDEHRSPAGYGHRKNSSMRGGGSQATEGRRGRPRRARGLTRQTGAGYLGWHMNRAAAPVGWRRIQNRIRRPGGVRRACFYVTVLSFFCLFHWQVFQTDFARDEMHNLWSLWTPPRWKMLAALFLFWTKTVRPLAALYYVPLYQLFGLHPGSFTLVRNLALLVNTLIFCKLAGYVGRSAWVAMLASLPIAYQANLGNLAYDGAFIYDVLCGGFYFAALLYYIRRRRAQDSLCPGQIAMLSVLYIAALDSKEMAVSLPVMILAYELLFQGRKARFGPLIPIVILTAIFIYGKTTGEGALTELEAYRPVFVWSRFAESNTRLMNEIFYTSAFTFGRVVGVWAVVLYLGLRNWGLRTWDPRWLFLLVWVVVTPLPVAFLTGRGGGVFYIPAAGWAILTALAMRAVVRRFAQEPVAGLSRKTILAAGWCACAIAYTHETWRVDNQVRAGYLAAGFETRHAIEQFEALNLHPAQHSRIAFLNDPFPGTYHTLFMGALLWRDATLDIRLEHIEPIPKAELDRMDYIFDYVDGRFQSVKPAAKQ
jgi:hypothetical protein